jgi:hypothetical protein
MRDTELYRQLLGLEPPWEVSRMEGLENVVVIDARADNKPSASKA